ncbi:endonuclease domain-containing protein [Rhodococcus gannanensis]|uniref:Endonuclease domain-containing protein n=1 Tax=Rhodococcus gannanensis TaxID=1960308 RepID=A0ABW4NYQ5_9NOCA
MGDFDSPFLGSRAIADGRLTEHQLRHDFARIHRDVYVHRRVSVTAAVRARAAWLFAGPECTLTGFSSAALHGTRWIDDAAPAEVSRNGHFRSPPGLLAHDYTFEPDEVVDLQRIRVATAARAGFDLARRLPRDGAIVALDALCAATGVKPEAIADIADRHTGARGVRTVRQIVPDVDGGSQSPPETHTRLAIVDAGLPRPETQIAIATYDGAVFAHADLGWRRWRVLVEYDGAHHWIDRDQRSWDIERLARIEALGWTVIRVDSALLYRRRAALLARIVGKLREAGAAL